MRQFVLLLSVLFLCLSPIQAHAGFEEGKAAYERDDWYQAILNLRPLADQGDVRAMMILAHMYHEGKGVKQDLRLAFEFYQKAAKAGDSFAMVSLAALYSEGVAVPQNKKKALEYYQKAAEAGNQVGQFVMAAGHFSGMKDNLLEKDLERAYFWTLVAANNPIADPALSQRIVRFLAGLEKEFVTEIDTRNRLKIEAEKFLKEKHPQVNFPMLDTKRPIDLSTLYPGKKQKTEKQETTPKSDSEVVPDNSDINTDHSHADHMPTE